MMNYGLPYVLRKIKPSRVDNSRILSFNYAKFSGNYLCMKPNIQWNFQICISVPISFHKILPNFVLYFSLVIVSIQTFLQTLHLWDKETSRIVQFFLMKQNSKLFMVTIFHGYDHQSRKDFCRVVVFLEQFPGDSG